MTARPRPPKSHQVSATEFKAKCLALMDEVARTGDEIVISKHGRVVAKLVPAAVGIRQTPGWLRGTVTFLGDPTAPEPLSWADTPLYPDR